MKLRLATFLAAAIASSATPAKAIDIHNCTPFAIKLLFYNESDRIELIAKKGMEIASGGVMTKVSVPGSGTHKVKVLNASAGDRSLVTLAGVDGQASYVLLVDGSGIVSMQLGGGC